MYNPSHVLALVKAGQFLVEQMDEKGLLTAHLPGYLNVATQDLFQLACVHTAPFGHFCNDELILQKLSTRTTKVWSQVQSDDETPNGATSSDLRIIYGGAVLAKEMITAWASPDGDDPYGEEAVAIMINIIAGLLPRQKTRRQRCNPNRPNYNRHLHLLLDNITWTK